MLHFRHKRWLLPWLAAAGGFLVIVMIFAVLRNHPSMDDALRHFMMGRAMAEQGILRVRGWSGWFFSGYAHDHIVDPWFLSNVLYVPFSGFPVVEGLKLFSLASILALLLSFGLCLRALRVGPVASALLILLLLFGHRTYTYRLLFGRPFTLVTALTLLLLLSILRERFLWSGLLLCVLTLMSHLFFFPLGVSMVGCVWLAYTGRKTSAIRLFWLSMGGVAVGFLLHPTSVEYLQYLWFVFIKSSFYPLFDKGGELGSGLGKGVILYPLLGFAVLLQTLLIRERRSVGNVIFLLDVLVAAFFLQFLIWLRAIDFLWPLLLLLIGALLADGGRVLERLGRLLLPPVFVKTSVVATLLLLLCGATIGRLTYDLISTDGSRSLRSLQQALERVPPRARILNVEWDYFSPFVAVRPDLQYALGMDPAFTYMSSLRAYGLLRLIFPPIEGLPDARSFIDARRWTCALLSEYPAEYVLLSVAREGPIVESLRSQGLRDVSGDPRWMVFRANNASCGT
ncbi:MAG: hypothetical protein WC840_02385 [Candidatus Peribacteraceae bacterium]